MNKSELHNHLSKRFVIEIVGEALRKGADDSDLLVLFESCQLGVMNILDTYYRQRPDVIVGLLEASLQRSIERFVVGRS